MRGENKLHVGLMQEIKYKHTQTHTLMAQIGLLSSRTCECAFVYFTHTQTHELIFYPTTRNLVLHRHTTHKHAV